MPKNNLSKILKALTPDKTSVDFNEFDKNVALLKSQLKEKIQIQTLDDVQNQLEKFKKKIDLQPLLDSMRKIDSSFKEHAQELYDEIESKTLELSKADKERVTNLHQEISDLQFEVSSLEEVRKKDLEKLTKDIKYLEIFEERVDEMFIEIGGRLDSLEEIEIPEQKDWTNYIQDEIDTLRKELLRRIGSIGGGNMNRQIFIGGANPLTRFTDINFKAGSNVTITYANNNATQKVDVTISATGGGGGGMVRSINNISTSQTAGSTSGTDYVYLCTGTLTLTMPDATAGNTNLYTVKNVGTGVVTINTTSAQTIDGSATIIMPVQYTAVDLVSDTANWNVT